MYTCGFALPGNERADFVVRLEQPIPVGAWLTIREAGIPTALIEGRWEGGPPPPGTARQVYTVRQHRYSLEGTVRIEPNEQTSIPIENLPVGHVFILHILE